MMLLMLFLLGQDRRRNKRQDHHEGRTNFPMKQEDAFPI